MFRAFIYVFRLTKGTSRFIDTRMKNKSWVSFIPAYWAALFDIIITITHQSTAYWQGNLTKANEGNPFGAYMMAHHVSGIFVICFIWLVIIGLVGRWYLTNIPKCFYCLFWLFIHGEHQLGYRNFMVFGQWSVSRCLLMRELACKEGYVFLAKEGSD